MLTLTSVAQGNSYTPPKISPALLKQDFSMLRDTMQKIHPGMYRYKSKKAIDKMFDSCYASIRDSMPATDFYAITSFAIACIQDGHTNCRMSGAAMNDYINNVKIFPAMVMFINSRVFVYCCKQNNDIAASELLSINGHTLHDVVQRLFRYIQSDGGIESHKNWEINENFSFLYNIIYGTSDSYNITFKTPTGETRTATLQANLLKNFRCPPPFTRPAKYLALNFKPGGVAILTIKTFFDGFLQQTHENFKTFLDSAFNDIKQKMVEKLIIDIRGNQGGNDENGALLYSYLTQKPFKYYASLETTTEKFAENRHSNLSIQQPKENNYSGKVYILADGRSFSASAEFSSIVKFNNRGLFIGEECGGGYYGNTSGDDITLTLPNTKIDCRIPMVKYTMAVKKVKNTDMGVMPDYPVYPTIGDMIEHKDSQLENAIQEAVRGKGLSQR